MYVHVKINSIILSLLIRFLHEINVQRLIVSFLLKMNDK